MRLLRVARNDSDEELDKFRALSLDGRGIGRGK
jgi:hypothetical protein